MQANRRRTNEAKNRERNKGEDLNERLLFRELERKTLIIKRGESQIKKSRVRKPGAKGSPRPSVPRVVRHLPGAGDVGVHYWYKKRKTL